MQLTIYLLKYFNPRLREGGDKRNRIFTRNRKNFNPRLREGGDLPCLQIQYNTGISIHASAREATCHSEKRRKRSQISIHASAREATILDIKSIRK